VGTASTSPSLSSTNANCITLLVGLFWDLFFRWDYTLVHIEVLTKLNEAGFFGGGS